MKTHTFLILSAPTDCYMDSIDDIYQSEDTEMIFVKCKNENVEDNLITVKYKQPYYTIKGDLHHDERELTLLRDVNGTLYLCNEILSKIDVINFFE